VHLDWALPLEVYAECMVTGDWPAMPVYADVPGRVEAQLRERVLVSGFLRTRESQMSVIPQDAAARGRAFPTPRTWDYAALLLGLARAVGANQRVLRLLAAGCVGDAVTHEYLTWVAAQDLADPDKLLADPTGFDFASLRSDRVYVTLQGVLGAVSRDSSGDRWTNALVLCTRAAAAVGVDPAVPVVRALMRGGLRPPGAAVPPEIKVFAPALALAGLLPDRPAA
jgi:hypothetical protein